MVEVKLNIIELQGDGFHPLVEVVLFGQPFTLVLDTGASKTTFDKEMLKEAKLSITLLSSDKLSTGLGTTTMESFSATIDDMQITGLQIPQFEVAVLDLSTINHAYAQLNLPSVLGVLGGDLLMQHMAIIDYGKSTMILH